MSARGGCRGLHWVNGATMTKQKLQQELSPSCHHNVTKMGRRVRLWWDGDQQWYEAVVVGYNSNNGRFILQYVDDLYECEEVVTDCNLHNWQLGVLQTTPSASSTSSGTTTAASSTSSSGSSRGSSSSTSSGGSRFVDVYNKNTCSVIYYYYRFFRCYCAAQQWQSEVASNQT